MPYLGSIPAANYKVVRKQTITGNGGTSYTLDYSVGNDQEIEVYVNNVRQEPGVAYTTSGTALTMTGTVASTDSFYVVFQGKAEQTISIPEKQNNGSYSFDSGFFFIDAPNNEIGIGTTAPTSNLHVIGTANVTSNVAIGGTLSVGGSNVSPVQSFRNKIINGNFDFWQRETSNTNVGTGGRYVADRWINVKFGAPTLNISRQAFTVGQTDVPYESQYFYRANTVSSTGSANGMFVGQRVESVRTLAGQTATLSFYAKADASKNVAVEFVQNFGTNGSAEANGVNVTSFSLTSSWQKFSTTITLPSISGKTVDSANANYLAVNFWLDAGSTYNTRTNTLGQQSGTFDIAQVQLEPGSVDTPFEVRPYGLEFAMCQRYYQGNKADGSAGDYGPAIFRGNNSAATGNFFYWMPFSVIMRGIPTMSVGNPTSSGSSSAAFYNATKHGAEFTFSVTSAGGYAFVPWTASAEL